MKILHITIIDPGNAGDIVLLDCTRKTLEKSTNQFIQWEFHNIYELVTEEDVNYFNTFDYLLIGGGGLFLKDTWENENSSWQWNCPTDKMKKITTPIIVFAIGYNRFRGQEDFLPCFTNNVRTLVNKSRFFSMRNNGSIGKLSHYLTPDLTKDLIFQPCPSLFADKFYQTPIPQAKNNLSINIAFDRQERRFGGAEEIYLNRLARVCKELSKFYSLFVTMHCPNDYKIVPYLDKIKVPYKTKYLFHKPTQEIIHFYSYMSVCISSRGHAQMIPMGLKKFVVSIITHDKLKYFLQDMSMKYLGIEVSDPQLDGKVLKLVEFYQKNRTKYHKEISTKINNMSRLTDSNLKNVLTL